MSRGAVGALEAGPRAMGDVLFAPADGAPASVDALLLALDHGSSRSNARLNALVESGVKSDCITRMVFGPERMSADAEEKYAHSKRTFENLPSVGTPLEDFPDEETAYLACGPQCVFFRQTPAACATSLARIRQTLNFDAAFPKCARAYASKRRWIWYRLGVLRVCKRPCSRDRECADHNVLGRIDRRFANLHDLFCAAEALWPHDDDPANDDQDQEEEEEEDYYSDNPDHFDGPYDYEIVDETTEFHKRGPS